MATFTRKMGTSKDVKDAVHKLVSEVVADGCSAALKDVKWEQLEKDIQDEYDCGADGTVYEVLCDLNDSVGLDEYNIFLYSE